MQTFLKTVLPYVFCILAGYLAGAVNFAWLLAKKRGFDIRTKGSGNAGTTNAGRTMGSGVAVVVIKNLVHMLGTSTACVGELADIIMSSCFIIPASLIYRRRKDRKSAVLSMAVGTVLMTIAGVLVNYFILIPAYQTLMNLPLEVIVGMGTKVWSYIDNTVKLVIFITAPFNILKGAVLSVVTYLLYKRVSPLLHQKSVR